MRAAIRSASTATSDSWLGVPVGLLAAMLGLLPWLVAGEPLPLQNLWATQTLPEQMPWAALPISQYYVPQVLALLVIGAALAGVAARALRTNEGAITSWQIWLGVSLVQWAAIVQVFVVLWLGLGIGRQGAGPALIYWLGMLAITALSWLLGMACFWMISRGSRPAFAIGIAIAAAPLSAWLAAAFVGQQESWLLPAGLSAAMPWLAALLVGAALGRCGLGSRQAVLAWLTSAALLLLGPALLESLGAMFGSARMMRGDPIAMLVWGARSLGPGALQAVAPTLGGLGFASLITGVGVLSRPPDTSAAPVADNGPMQSNLKDAFRAAPRGRFLPAAQRDLADWDAPIPIGHGATNSQPTTVSQMLELLDVQPGQRVLDVGAGSGWTTALLAHLVGPAGKVVGVERIAELLPAATAAIADWPWASITLAESGTLGLPVQAPYDRILVSAMADEIPDQLVEQLADDGVMVIPVDSVMQRVVRQPDATITTTRHGRYRFVPLIT